MDAYFHFMLSDLADVTIKIYKVQETKACKSSSPVSVVTIKWVLNKDICLAFGPYTDQKYIDLLALDVINQVAPDSNL